MPRPISWLPRLHQIRSSVDHSIRSHYERRDLELLFGIQSRSAQNLLEVLPTIKVGRSLLVSKEDLEAFLAAIHKADDPAQCLAELKEKPQATSKKKLRNLVKKDAIAATLDSLPGNLYLSLGRIEVTFDDVEQLALTLYALSQILENELPEFERRYEPNAPAGDQNQGGPSELQLLYQELEELEAKRASSTISER